MTSRAILNGWPIVPPSKATSEPAFTTLPSIAGTFTVGYTLTASPGVVSGFPAPTVAIQWKRNGQPIAGETGTTYTLVQADGGADISASFTASNARGVARYSPPPVSIAQGGGIDPPYAAPAGFQWAFVADNGKRTVDNSKRVITLIKAS